jgi:transcription elongation factor Elf1
VITVTTTLEVEATCPSCKRQRLPLAHGTNGGVVALCSGCGQEYTVDLVEGPRHRDVSELVVQVNHRLREALEGIQTGWDIVLTPSSCQKTVRRRQRRESR